jgi:hypothetical protein
MKRRDFLKNTFFFAAVSAVAGKTLGLFNEAMAVTMVAAAPDNQVKAGKQCKTCSWFKADAAGGAGNGQCTLKAMQQAMKAPAVYVAEAGYCNMWKKK